MAEIGKGRKQTDRRRVRANRVVEVAKTGKAAKTTGFRISRTAAFQSGAGTHGKNGRA